MLTIPAGGTLAGVADVASKVTMTINGMEYNTSTAVETYKTVYQGQLPNAAATVYTASANGPTFCRSISVVNTDTSSRTFQLFIGGTAATNQITPTMTLAAGGLATYEDGVGWSNVSIPAGTTLLNDIHTGYQDWSAISVPSAPAADTLRMFARKASGRMLPKWIGPSGVDTFVQPAFFANNLVMYYPTSSTNGGTATLGTWGTSWTAGGTVSHPTPSSGIVNQMRRTRYANVVTTANQTLGLVAIAAGMPQFWRGSGAGQGGFFFHVRYTVELWAASTCRIFVGLQDSTTAQVTLDIASMTGNICGFAHDTSDSNTQMWFVTRDNTTTHKTSITVPTIAAGEGYDFFIFAKPNDSTIYYRMDRINDGSTIVDTSETNNLPLNTAFMGVAATMSNGTANTVVTTVAPGINRIYVESDH